MGKQHPAEEQMTIQYLRNQLDWYVHEASDVEYDQKKVKAMLDLLKLLDPPEFEEDEFSPERALERFWETLELRQQIHEEMERMQRHGLKIVKAPITFEEAEEESQEGTPVKEPGKIKKIFQHKVASKAIIAAALVVIVSVSGSVGAYAEKAGFFHFLNHQSDDGFAVITSPSVRPADENSIYRYDSFDSVPVKYLDYIWTPSDTPNDLNLQFVEIWNNPERLLTRSVFKNVDLNLFAEFARTDFDEKIMVAYQKLDSFEEFETELLNSVEIKYYRKKNDDYTEYMVEFFYEQSYYSLTSNLELDTIEKMINESIEELFK